MDAGMSRGRPSAPAPVDAVWRGSPEPMARIIGAGDELPAGRGEQGTPLGPLARLLHEGVAGTATTMPLSTPTTMMVMLMITSIATKSSSSYPSSDLHEASSTNDTSTATATPSLGATGFGLLAALMGVTTAASVTLNTVVVATTFRHRVLRQPVNYALLSLACADLGVALGGGVPTTVTNAMRFQLLMREPLCQVEGFLVSFFGLAGLNSICVLAAERYVMVCRPLSSMRLGGSHALLALGAAWLWALVWSTPPLLGWGRYAPEGLGTSCAPDWSDPSGLGRSYIFSLLLFCFVLPLIVIVFCYASLLRSLHRASRVKYSGSQRAEQRVGVMVLLMIVAFLFCWLPYAACALVIIFQPGIQLSPLAASVPLYAAKSSTAYNPIIYILLNRQFREHIRCTLCGSRTSHNPNMGTDPERTAHGRNGRENNAVSSL